MKGTKGSETKALIRETAFKQFLTKDYSMVPLKDIEKSLNLSRGCMSYHYPTKQELLVDVIDVYILDVQRTKHSSDNIVDISLFDYFNQYVDNIAKAMDRLSQFILPEENINGTRAYMTLILQAEKYYPGFHQLLCEIEKNEMVQLKQIIINAQKNGEIRSTCNTDLLVQQIRLVFLGKSYQDALKNGLDINGLREQLKTSERMKNDVFITGTSCFFPNEPILNEDMEDFLGLIAGKHSRVKPIILKQNGIKQRYYALTKKQEITHTNAEMAIRSIQRLLEHSAITNQEIELLTCATSSPDQMLPSHASMVHGLMKNKPLEIFSASGICLSCLQAFKTAFWGVLTGEKRNAICSTSELTSATLLSKNYDIEYERCADLGTQPYMALEKDFLRFMLSDGASAVLLQDNPGNGKALKVEWVEMTSFANELPTCMFMGAESEENGDLRSWKSFSNQERIDRSLFVVKQDVKLLGNHAVPYWAKHIKYCLEKHKVSPDTISYVLPHVSSMFFYDKIINELKQTGIGIDEGKWFTNLPKVGNIASAAIFAILDEFWKTRELTSGEKILLLVPESGRFSYGTVLLSVV